MPESPSYLRRFFRKAFSETAAFTQKKLLVSALMGIIVRVAFWEFAKIRVTWAELGRDLLIFVGSYIVVIIGSFVVNLFRSPGLLDKERADEIAVLNARLKIAEPLNRQKEIRMTFVNLIREGHALKGQMLVPQTGAESSRSGRQLNDWVKRTEGALIEADMHSEAVAFISSGERPSPEHLKAVPANIGKETWKHPDVARFTAYLAELQEIIKRKGL